VSSNSQVGFVHVGELCTRASCTPLYQHYCHQSRLFLYHQLIWLRHAQSRACQPSSRNRLKSPPCVLDAALKPYLQRNSQNDRCAVASFLTSRLATAEHTLYIYEENTKKKRSKHSTQEEERSSANEPTAAPTRIISSPLPLKLGTLTTPQIWSPSACFRNPPAPA